MNISIASALIINAFAAGRISAETARDAHQAIRQTHYYGQRMTSGDRARIVRVRFAIEG